MKAGEHIEIVLPGDPATLNARALALLADDGLSQPGIVVKTSSPKGEHERLPNPTGGDRRQRDGQISSVVY